ncbi:ABC transporter ATP-binding protein [Methanothrix sp.]|uniref:ABC transporter ATP-binding protein n=1 Tax=Methanothrix sp. TaxID=90426 RepID=UPI003BB4B182
MKIELQNLGFRFGDAIVFKEINLLLDKPNLTCIIGPNGSGKSTLMHCINKILIPVEGVVLLDDVDIKLIGFNNLAKCVSYVPNYASDTFAMTVMDTVLMGRYPHKDVNTTDRDIQFAVDNLKLLGIENLSMRKSDELSAGQYKKVLIARGLTQEPKMLMLDEPMSNLDINHQIQVMKLLRKLTRTKQISVLAICHDLNIAARYADRIIMLANERIYASGTASEIITVKNIKTVYGVDCRIIENEGRPYVIILAGLDEYDNFTRSDFQKNIDLLV